jgi:hypothetical protein
MQETEAFRSGLAQMPWDKGASVRDPAAITRSWWRAMGEQQEAGQAAFLKRKWLGWRSRLIVVKINRSQALRDRT